MKKRIMIIALAVIAISLTMSLGAQTIYGDLGELQSNTSKATVGLFTNDVDDYMDVHDYSDVLTGESKWFSFISGKTIAGGVLDIGYARKFGGVYLGTWFRGNIFRTSAGNVETKTIAPTYDDNLEILTSRTDTTSYNSVWNESANNFEFLIGVKGMGFKVGFFESTASNKNDGSPLRDVSVTDYLDGRKDYTDAIDTYINSQSHLKPYIGWGSTFTVGKLSIKPIVDFSVAVHRDTLIDKYYSYTEINGEKQDLQTAVGEGHKNGYVEPQGTIGAWVDLQKKGTTQTSLGIAYTVAGRLTSNDADVLGGVDGTVSWDAGGRINYETKYTDRTVTETTMTFNVSEKTHIKHQILPAYKIISDPVENFSWGFLAAIPIIVISESNNDYTKRIQNTSVKYNWDLPGYTHENALTTYNGKTEYSFFGFGLYFALGASYQLIPGRFGINAGIAASPISYVHEAVRTVPRSVESVETNKITQDDGSVTTNNKNVTLATNDDVVVVSDKWDQYISQLSGGFTFNFTPKAALDFAVSGGNFTDNTFNLNIANVNVIFTFKF